MSDFPFATIGFDLDGTLVDSNRDLCPAINHALGLIGREAVPPEATRKLIGGGAKLMLARALELTGGTLPEDELDALHGELLAHYEAHIADHTVLYPGCLEALNALAAHGCSLAVVTNKIERFARKLLEELGMANRFTAILGGDTLGPGRGKPAPDMIEEAVRQCGAGAFAMVGDSSYDVRAAQAAGAPCVVLSYGYHDAPPHTLGAEAVIDHYDELIPVLEELGRR